VDNAVVPTTPPPRDIATGGAVVLIATVLTSALGVAYTIAMARLLSPVDYATLVSLLSLLSVASLPAGPIQTVVARATAVAIGRGEPDPTLPVVREHGPRIGGLALALTLGAAVAVPWLAGFLQFEDPLLLWLGVPILGLGMLQPLLRGLAQGRSRFVLLASAAVIDIGGKVLGGVALALAGFAVRGALGAILAGGIASFVLVLAVFRRDSRLVPANHGAGGMPVETGWSSIVATSLAFGSLTALVTLDAVLVKHQFPDEVAATYAVLSVAGRSLFWATGAITTVLLPVVARQAGAGNRGRESLWLGLAITVAVAGAGELAFLVAPTLIVTMLFGATYLAAAPMLPVFGLGSLSLSLASVVLTWLVAQGRQAGAVIVPFAVLAQIAAILSGPDGLADALARIVAVNGATLAALIAAAVMRERAVERSGAVPA
jgi:O-antigen/teichoic acid export membrane protein